MNYRDTASFGKRIEYKIISQMLNEGLDVYKPLVDDHGVDCIIKSKKGTFIEIQIKARSNKVRFGSAAFFQVDQIPKIENYYFVFYSERMNTIWIMSAKEFTKNCIKNKTGKHKGKMQIWMNGKDTKSKKEFCKDNYKKYINTDFNIFYKM